MMDNITEIAIIKDLRKTSAEYTRLMSEARDGNNKIFDDMFVRFHFYEGAIHAIGSAMQTVRDHCGVGVTIDTEDLIHKSDVMNRLNKLLESSDGYEADGIREALSIVESESPVHGYIVSDKWVSCKDAFPDDNIFVYICTDDGFVDIGYRYGDRWFDIHEGIYVLEAVTHWMSMEHPDRPSEYKN